MPTRVASVSHQCVQPDILLCSGTRQCLRSQVLRDSFAMHCGRKQVHGGEACALTTMKVSLSERNQERSGGREQEFSQRTSLMSKEVTKGAKRSVCGTVTEVRNEPMREEIAPRSREREKISAIRERVFETMVRDETNRSQRESAQQRTVCAKHRLRVKTRHTRQTCATHSRTCVAHGRRRRQRSGQRLVVRGSSVAIKRTGEDDGRRLRARGGVN